MKPGDLIKPLASCGGEPGSKRCDVAIVLERRNAGTNFESAVICCPCGSSEQYLQQLETINPELAYSSDPM